MVHTTDHEAVRSFISCRCFDFERDGIHVAGGGFTGQRLTVVVSCRKQCGRSWTSWYRQVRRPYGHAAGIALVNGFGEGNRYWELYCPGHHR